MNGGRRRQTLGDFQRHSESLIGGSCLWSKAHRCKELYEAALCLRVRHVISDAFMQPYHMNAAHNAACRPTGCKHISLTSVCVAQICSCNVFAARSSVDGLSESTPGRSSWARSGQMGFFGPIRTLNRHSIPCAEVTVIALPWNSATLIELMMTPLD